MRYLTYLLADEYGESYFEDRLLPESSAHDIFPVTVTALFSGGEVLDWYSDSLKLDWVNAPQRQCFIKIKNSPLYIRGVFVTL